MGFTDIFHYSLTLSVVVIIVAFIILWNVAVWLLQLAHQKKFRKSLLGRYVKAGGSAVRTMGGLVLVGVVYPVNGFWMFYYMRSIRRHVIVTGGSQGLGRELATEYAKLGTAQTREAKVVHVR